MKTGKEIVIKTIGSMPFRMQCIFGIVFAVLWTIMPISLIWACLAEFYIIIKEEFNNDYRENSELFTTCWKAFIKGKKL